MGRLSAEWATLAWRVASPRRWPADLCIPVAVRANCATRWWFRRNCRCEEVLPSTVSLIYRHHPMAPPLSTRNLPPPPHHVITFVFIHRFFEIMMIIFQKKKLLSFMDSRVWNQWWYSSTSRVNQTENLLSRCWYIFHHQMRRNHHGRGILLLWSTSLMNFYRTLLGFCYYYLNCCSFRVARAPESASFVV